MRFGLISSGLDGFCRAIRNATSAPPPRTTTITTNANKFLSARMCTSSERRIGRLGPRIKLRCHERARSRSPTQALTPTPRTACPITARPGRRVRASSTDADARELRAIVLRDAGARAPDLDDVGIAAEPGGAAEIAQHLSGDGGVVGVDQLRLESSAAERAQEHAARGRAAREDRRVVLASEEGEAFAARHDEPVGVEVHPQRAGVGVRETPGRRRRPARGEWRAAPGRRRRRAARAARRSRRPAWPGRRVRRRRSCHRRARPSSHRRADRSPSRAPPDVAPPARRRARRGSSPSPSGNETGRPSRPVPRVRNIPRRTLPCSRSSAARRGKAARTDSAAASPA